MTINAFDLFPITGLPEGWTGNVQPNRYGEWIAKASRYQTGAEVSVIGHDPILATHQVRAAAYAITEAKVPGCADS